MMAFIIYILLNVINSANGDNCADISAAGITTCHGCADITILNGDPGCAYCEFPYKGQSHCQAKFYPPSADIPGLTVYACYNDTGNPVPTLRYVPRCARDDCYVGQCLISGLILWQIIVPCVIGGVLIFIGCPLWCWCRKRNRDSMNKWKDNQDKQIKKDEQIRKDKAVARNVNRTKLREQLRNKYKLDEDSDVEESGV